MPDDSSTTREFLTKVREATEPELLDRLNDVTERLFRLRIRMASSQLEDPTRIRKYRKAIARIKTELRRRELQAEGAAESAV
jgi:large subunit ribosomal protein L29